MAALAFNRLAPAASPSPAAAELPRDAEWFTAVYERTFDSVYRLASLLTRDRHLAEDVTAETYVRVWSRRSSLAGAEAPWILAIARNCAFDALRTRRPALDLFNLPEVEDRAEGAPGALDPETVRLLQDCLARLTPEQQQVLFMRFDEALPHEVVARRLGKKPNAIRAIQFRALARLRTLMEASRVRS